MRLRILGCSGGIGGSLRTTSMLLDNDILIDAGTGVGDLSIEELSRIDHVFLTHSHLDHVTSIPFLVDSVGWMRDKPLTVYAIEPTLEIIRQHLFNWKLWPDFTRDSLAWYRAGKLTWRETVHEGVDKSVDAFLGLFTGETPDPNGWLQPVGEAAPTKKVAAAGVRLRFWPRTLRRERMQGFRL